MTSLTSEEIAGCLDRWSITGQLKIAYSGGRDSHVLLHALASAGVPIQAIHVDHALHAESAHWAAHCRAVCEALGVALTVHRVDVVPAGEGIEAAARRARYAALASCLASGDFLATAHHADDQAETVLLHLLRGSGPNGLAGMPAERLLGRGRLIRPLLALPRERLTAYAHAHRLRWIEDPANADRDLDRSYLRHEIMARLATRWPVAEAVGRSSTHLSEATEVLYHLLGEELDAGGAGATLPVDVLARRDDAAHRQLLLRAWLRRRGVRPPPEARLRAGVAALLTAAEDRSPVLAWREGQLRRYRGRLYLLPPELPAPPSAPIPWQPKQPLLLSGIGVLSAVSARGQGLAAEPELTVRFRHGGERIRPAGTAHRRPLKSLLQEWGIPPWERDRLPLIYAGDRLVAVADRVVAAGAAAGKEAAGLLLHWQPEA